MSKKENDNKENFDLLAHEKKLSELYQSDKQRELEQPSAHLNTAIKAMAEQQLLNNSTAVIKEQAFKDQLLKEQANTCKNTNDSIKNKRKYAWQWPFSLVASVGLLAVLMMTQRDYFIHPNDIFTTNVDSVNDTVAFAPDIQLAETPTQGIVAQPPLQYRKMSSPTQPHELLLGTKSTLEFKPEGKVASIANMSASKTSHLSEVQEPEVQVADRFKVNSKVAKTSEMSLLELSKLAQLLTLELDLQKTHKAADHKVITASIVNMQQTLFEQLIQYQKSHTEFRITNKYLDLLTDQQVLQLTQSNTHVVPEN